MSGLAPASKCTSLIHLLQQALVIAPIILIVGIELVSRAVLIEGSPQVALVLQPRAEVAVRLGIVLVQAQRFALFPDFSIPVALLSERDAEAAVCTSKIRIQAQCFALFRDFSIPVALLSERGAEVAMCASALLGFKRRASRSSAICSIPVALVLPSATPRSDVRFGIIWVQAQRFALFCDRPVPVALLFRARRRGCRAPRHHSGSSAALRVLPRFPHPSRPFFRAQTPRLSCAIVIIGVQAHRLACCGLAHRPTSAA